MNGTDVVEMDRERPTGQNRDFPWDSFDSASYFDHNYLSMRGDDRIIVEFIRDFFASAGIPEGSRAIDVGTGPNLYPALAVLPFVESIELYEFSAKNVDWLRRQQQAGWPTWDQSLSAFWRLYALSAGHAGLADPRRALADRVSVVQGSVFDLERHPSVPFDAGTMFFCAESLSDDREEFDAAVAQFLGVLKEGAPFAAAFMEMSEGYDVDEVRFPATAVDAGDIARTVLRGASEVTLKPVGIDGEPLRPGYSGMIVATGRANGRPVAR